MTPLDIIEINKINSSFISIETTDEGILRHISDFFTFLTPNFKFHPAYKSGKWDGKIRLLQKGRYLYSGLQSRLIKFLKDNNYKFNNNNHFDQLFSRTLVNEIISNIPLPYPLREYQKESVLTLLEKGSGLLVSPTSSGKSLILFLILVILLKTIKPKKIIIGVPTISLVQQLASDFLSYCSTEKLLNFFNHNVHLLFGGQEKETSKRIIIGTFSSFGNFPESYFHDVDIVIGDECHLLSKQYGKHIFENSINSIFRMGCTGTLQDSVLDKLVLEGLFGNPIQLINTHELIENNHAAKLKIVPVIFHYSTEICNTIKSLEYRDEYDFIMTNSKRIEIVSNFAHSLKNNTLILFTKIEKHGDLLLESLKKLNINSGKKIIYITGKTDIEDREYSRLLAEEHNNLILLCSYGVFAQGINIKNLHNIIFASPYKAKIKVLQSIGRGLRLHDLKKMCMVYDFVDDARVKNSKNHIVSSNFLFDHFLERYKLYQQENFEVEITHFPEIIN